MKLFTYGSSHANEWITTPLIMKFVETYCDAYITSGDISGISSKTIFDKSSLFIVPMLNPDGVDLVTNNINIDSTYYINAKTTSANFPNIPFPSGWKANITGIDLNLQFPALWDEAKRIKYAQGYTKPAPRDFVRKIPSRSSRVNCYIRFYYKSQL